MLARAKGLRALRPSLYDAMHRVLLHVELHADAAASSAIELVEQRAAAGQVMPRRACRSTMSGGRSSSARWTKSAIACTGSVSASAMSSAPSTALFGRPSRRSRPLMCISTCAAVGLAQAPCRPRS